MAEDMRRIIARRSAGTTEAVAGGRVTMLDIARAAGCSQSTVSFVLNGTDGIRISATTRDRVLAIATEMGYRRADLAGLRRATAREGGVIALVIDKMTTSPEGVVVLDGLREAARGMGAIVLAAETDNDAVIEPRTIETFLRMEVRMIVYACIFTRQVTVPPILLDAAVPVVLLNCYADVPLPAVVPDEVAGGLRATQTLVDAGHGRIGTITGEAFMEAARDRLQGYREALRGAGIPVRSELVVEGDWSASAGYRSTRALMDLAAPPTAIFCQNDRMAIGCYEALKELGLRIPEDISVVGYDDEEIARHMSPPLTSLILPSRAMGRWAVERVVAAPEDAASHARVRLQCELVRRQSIASPRQPDVKDFAAFNGVKPQ